MLKLLLTFLIVFAMWLVLTFSLNMQEIIAGLVVSFLVAILSREFLFKGKPHKLLNPIRWFNSLVYIVVFLCVEIKAHLDLSYRIITGKINPAIIEVKTNFKTNVGKTLLGNSITLTPGTLTVRIGKHLHVHWIAFNKKEKIGRLFEKFGIKVTE